MIIVIAKEPVHGDILCATSYETAIKALIKNGNLNECTEANYGYYSGLELGEIYPGDWEEKVLKDYTILEDLGMFYFTTVHLYDKEEVDSDE